ncbi:MAG: type II toxin-antitoxin system RelE/ParE family toxin [Verrucomicrobiales bacterium]
MDFEFHPEAEDEQREARAYYEAYDPDSVRRLEDEIELTVRTVLANPLLFRLRGDHRRANLPKYPYYLPFVILDERLIFLAVAHNARKPGYWKDRLAQ